MITLLDGPLGAASEIHAAPHWRGIELLSDLHLGEQAPATAHALAEHLAASDADLIVLLGDLFEVWIGDEQLDAPADPVSPMAQALQALAEAARRRPVAMLTGNRDFLLGPEGLGDGLLKALGALEKAEYTTVYQDLGEERFEWAAVPAVVLLALELWLSGRKKRRAAASRKGVA